MGIHFQLFWMADEAILYSMVHAANENAGIDKSEDSE